NNSRILTRDNIADLKSKSDYTEETFYKQLSYSDLLGGLFAFKADIDREYCIYLYLYCGASNESTFKYKLLGCGRVKSGKTKYGKLKFYAYYIKNVAEHDDGPVGEYYWTFSNTFNMNKFSRSESNAVEMNDKTYWLLKQGKYETSDPGKTKQDAYVYEVELDRRSKHSYSLEWDPWEDDGLDDHLGHMKLIMTYDPENDTWTCKTDMWVDNGTETNNTYTLKAGQESDGNYEGIYDTDGEVEFHWDWSWSKSGTANEVFTTVSN
ncbi:MAG: hypothetical protein IKP67_01420, partial [Spirochaetales bacterium]|nr:hypothetical protein [Spirochaetales bacterium]